MQSWIVSGTYLISVAFLWGATNPFIRRGTLGVEKIKQKNLVLQFFSEIKFLIANWKYMVPFILNQCGSVLYFLTLQSTDISLAVPVANSLTFVFTWIVGQALGEEPVDKRTTLGMVFIMLGITLCFIDKGWYGNKTKVY